MSGGIESQQSGPMDNGPLILKPGDNPKPYPSLEAVKELSKLLYGLTINTVQELNSYDDRNYFITVEDEVNNPHIKDLWPHGYVLKILNSIDSKKTDFIDAQNVMMSHVRQRGFSSIQQCITNVNGQLKSLEKIAIEKPDSNGPKCYDSYVVRLFTFVPGNLISSVPYTTDLLYQVGQYIGKFDLCLKDFDHKGYDECNNLIWNFLYVDKLLEFIDVLDDPQQNALVRSIVQAYQNEVQPNVSQLSKGIIHGDLNEQNILVCKSCQGHISGDEKQYSVACVLDFGDSCNGYYVWEIAVTIMYMMLDSNSVDPMNVGGYILAGFLRNITLNETEWNILKICVASRFAQSLTLGAHSYAKNPTNKYLICTANKNGWAILDTFWKLPKAELYSRWKEIILTYKN